jgi:hypothetical protein
MNLHVLLTVCRKEMVDDVMDLLLSENTVSTSDHLSYQVLSSCCEDGGDPGSSLPSTMTRQFDSKIFYNYSL